MADLTTPMWRLLGIEVPIVQALIGTLAAPELAAVSQLLVGPRSELGEGLAMCLRSTARPVPIILIWAARSGGNRHARAVQNGGIVRSTQVQGQSHSVTSVRQSCRSLLPIAE